MIETWDFIRHFNAVSGHCCSFDTGTTVSDSLVSINYSEAKLAPCASFLPATLGLGFQRGAVIGLAGIEKSNLIGATRGVRPLVRPSRRRRPNTH